MSSALLWQNKRLLLFPTGSFLGVIACIVGFYRYEAQQGRLELWWNFWEESAYWKDNPEMYVSLFTLYVSEYVVILFFNTALVASVLRILSGGNPSFFYGLFIAIKRIPQILGWAILSALFDIALTVIERINEKVGEVVSWVLGSAWSSLSFFVVPVMVDDGVGPFEASRRSAHRLRLAWGEQVVGTYILGYLALFLCIPVVGILYGMSWVSKTYGVVIETGSYWVIGFLLFMLVCVISSATSALFKCFLYTYATQQCLPEEIDKRKLASFFR